MTVGVCGLGLIGGSFVKAYHAEGHRVLVFNRSISVCSRVIEEGQADGLLTNDNIGSCDLVLVTVYPEAAIKYISDAAPYIGDRPIVIDCCGTKNTVCSAVFEIAEQYGFKYIGGHPMAGTQNSGYDYSRAEMYKNAPMVLVPAPKDFENTELIDEAKKLLSPAGFGRYSVTTPDMHDKIIAFTSQLAHVVSNAYIKSPTAKNHFGFSAGSYKDLTRVAWLNPVMWSELFLENKENLLFELDTIINSLGEYRKAIAEDNSEELIRLLDEGRILKKEVDG